MAANCFSRVAARCAGATGISTPFMAFPDNGAVQAENAVAPEQARSSCYMIVLGRPVRARDRWRPEALEDLLGWGCLSWIG